jgi:hypothetical protein
MAFGSRRRVEAELLDLVRGELATVRAELQATLAESVALLSTRVRSEVELRMGEPSAIVAGLQDMRKGLTARDSELANVLRQVAVTCENLAERVQLDRIERSALVDAVSRLTTTLAIAGTFPTPQPRTTVIGGTVDPDQATVPSVIPAPVEPNAPRVDTEIETETEIDLDAEERSVDAGDTPTPTPPATPIPATAVRQVPPRDGVEVRCRFGDRWVTGFEVCEVIRFDDEIRYRLRRRSDGSVLPTLFDEKDLRFFTTSFIEQ